MIFYFLFQLNGPSMEPTIHSGDIAIGERHPKNVTRGDVLLLKSPLEPEDLIVKRLKGLPGDIKRSGFLFAEVWCALLWAALW